MNGWGGATGYKAPRDAPPLAPGWAENAFRGFGFVAYDVGGIVWIDRAYVGYGLWYGK